MDQPAVTWDPVREGLIRRLDFKIVTEGTITLPAVPALLNDYTDKCARIFAEVGRGFSDDEKAGLRSILARLLSEAFDRSQRSTITISYRSVPAGPLSYHVSINCMTIEEA